MWTPNAVFALAGVLLLWRLETPGDRDFVAWLKRMPEQMLAKLRPHDKPAGYGAEARLRVLSRC